MYLNPRLSSLPQNIQGSHCIYVIYILHRNYEHCRSESLLIVRSPWMAATLTDREALITLHQPPGSRNFEPRGRLKHNLEMSALNLWNNSYTREEMKGWDGRLKMYATHSLFSRLAFVFHVVQYEVLPSPLTPGLVVYMDSPVVFKCLVIIVWCPYL